MDGPTIEIRYATWAALRRDCEQQLHRGGLLARITVDVEQYQPVTLAVRRPDGVVHSWSAQVLQLIPGQGVALQFDTGDGQALERLRQAGEGDHPADLEPAGEEPVASLIAARTVSAGPPKLPTDPQELRRQLESMTVNEKRQAALGARREARLLLIRDRNKAVHPFVLKNPAITLDEVEQIAKMPSVNPDALRFIAGHRDWTRSTAVCRSLVKNPKTPMREAMAMLERLPMSDLRAIAKSANVRMPLLQAARKKVHQ
jgi:hypothetical protein